MPEAGRNESEEPESPTASSNTRTITALISELDNIRQEQNPCVIADTGTVTEESTVENHVQGTSAVVSTGPIKEIIKDSSVSEVVDSTKVSP